MAAALPPTGVWTPHNAHLNPTGPTGHMGDSFADNPLPHRDDAAVVYRRHYTVVRGAYVAAAHRVLRLFVQVALSPSRGEFDTVVDGPGDVGDGFVVRRQHEAVDGTAGASRVDGPGNEGFAGRWQDVLAREAF